MPAPGSEPLAFKSVFAASPVLQAKTCIERALKQVSKLLVVSEPPVVGEALVVSERGWQYVTVTVLVAAVSC